jgi:hypothetical protein
MDPTPSVDGPPPTGVGRYTATPVLSAPRKATGSPVAHMAVSPQTANVPILIRPCDRMPPPLA